MSTSEEPKVADATQDQNDEWIVQSKPRRLVPQHSLSRQDLEADKGKVPVASSDPKKKVIRFTKEEMMTFRQPVPILSFMADMTDVVSQERLNPVCFERFEPEDVIRIWNTDKSGGKGADAGRGRGRGAKPFNKQDEAGGDHVPGDWSTAREGGAATKGGLWDDSGAGSAGGDGLDLEDFAAMAMKFRTEMENMKLNGEGDGELGGVVHDTMTMLASEQSRRAAGCIEDDDDALPDWATDEPVAPPAEKRSLLLDTLNVKRQETNASVMYGLSGGLDLQLNSTVVQAQVQATPAPPPLLRVEPSEWQYTDPQGQVQGPFEQENMRQWHEAGYFNADLPIKMRHWQRFHPFQDVFPDFKIAFLNVPQEPGTSSMLLSLQQQQQQQQQAALLRQQEEQRKEQERLAAIEAQRRIAQLEAEKQAQIQRQQAELQRQQQQAQQLLLQQQQAELEAQQLLLEQQRLQAAAAAEEQAAAPSPVERQARPSQGAPVAPWANKVPGANRNKDLAAIQSEEAAAREVERKKAAAEQARVSKGWAAPANNGSVLSLAEIQQQEAAQRQAAEAAARASSATAAPATTNMSFQLKNLLGVKSAPAPAATSTGPAWGSPAAPAQQSKSAASLRDIMEQENSTRQDVSEPAVRTVGGASVSAPAPARKGSSWAAKAGSTTFSAPEPVSVPKRAPASAPAPAPVTQAPATAPVAAVPAPRGPATATKEKSSFGGKEMSGEMATWCAAQLRRINGSDDLTLMQFCMSLDSAADIRQYMSEILGSSPAVTNFATDFIKYKEGGKRAVEGTTLSGSAAGPASNNNNPSGFVSAGKKKSGKK